MIEQQRAVAQLVRERARVVVDVAAARIAPVVDPAALLLGTRRLVARVAGRIHPRLHERFHPLQHGLDQRIGQPALDQDQLHRHPVGVADVAAAEAPVREASVVVLVARQRGDGLVREPLRHDAARQVVVGGERHGRHQAAIQDQLARESVELGDHRMPGVEIARVAGDVERLEEAVAQHAVEHSAREHLVVV